MKPAAFDYVRPRDVGEALSALRAAGGEAHRDLGESRRGLAEMLGSAVGIDDGQSAVTNDARQEGAENGHGRDLMIFLGPCRFRIARLRS